MLDTSIRMFLSSNQAIAGASFSMTGVAPVTPAGFRLLSTCFMTNADATTSGARRRRIEVRTRPQLMSHSSVAEYIANEQRNSAGGLILASDTMLLRGQNVLDHQVGAAVVFHECVYALQDASGPRRVAEVDDEGAAHLAEAWFHLEHGNSPTNLPEGMNGDQASVFADLTSVFAIAGPIRARRQQPNQPVPVTQAERTALRQFVVSQGYRRRGVYQNSGIRRGGRAHRIRDGAWN